MKTNIAIEVNHPILDTLDTQRKVEIFSICNRFDKHNRVGTWLSSVKLTVEGDKVFATPTVYLRKKELRLLAEGFLELMLNDNKLEYPGGVTMTPVLPNRAPTIYTGQVI